MDWPVGELTITEPWSRATAIGVPNGVVYLGITNKGAMPDKLTEVSSDVATRSEIHETMKNMPGMMMMEPVKDGLPVPAGQSVSLKPSGLHIMLIGLKHQLKPGDTVPLTLTFEKAGKVDITADVGFPGAMKPPKSSKP